MDIKKIAFIIFVTIAITFLTYSASTKKENPKNGGVQSNIKEEDIRPQEVRGKIGWITDLHASHDEKTKINDHDVIYSKSYQKYLPKFFEKMEAEEIETVVVTGDITSNGQKDEAMNLKKIAEGFEGGVLWVRGNHDKESTETMENLGVEAPYYYMFDTKEVRVIVLNVTDDEDGVSEKQMEWLRGEINETEQDIIVALHIPIVNYEKETVIPEFLELEKMLRESGKVKLVLSGSLHKDKKLTLGGILYMTAYPLTLEDHAGTYYIAEKIGGTWNVRREKLEENK